MGILSGLFSSDTVDKGVEAIIDAGDAAFYTDEEKAKDFKEGMKIKIEMLKALHPFKLAQRYLALIFAFNFSVAFLTGLVLAVLGETDKIELVIKVAVAFQIGWIIIAIVTFYFGGGFINSAKKGNG